MWGSTDLSSGWIRWLPSMHVDRRLFDSLVRVLTRERNTDLTRNSGQVTLHSAPHCSIQSIAFDALDTNVCSDGYFTTRYVFASQISTTKVIRM